MAFTGFPDAAFTFYEQLTADNTRTFWLAHKDTYRAAVRQPMDELLAELGEFGPFHVFRPNKDVRFSKDKRQYKDHIAHEGDVLQVVANDHCGERPSLNLVGNEVY